MTLSRKKTVQKPKGGKFAQIQPFSPLEKQQILEFILKFIEERGAPLTLREITERFGMSSPASAQGHLEALEKKGYIRRRGFSARGIEPICEKIRKLFWQRQGIPLVGRVASRVSANREEERHLVLVR